MSYLPEVVSLGAEDGNQNSYEVLDAMKVPLEGLVRPWPWRVLIAPLSPPKKTKGGIILADDTADAQDHLVSVGRLLDMGPQAMKGKRLRGDDLSDWAPEIGDWVMYGRYAGQRLYHAKTGLRLVICNDDDIFGPIADPQDWRILV